MRIRHHLVTLSLLSAMGCGTAADPPPPPPNECDARCSSLWSFVYDKDFSTHQGVAVGADARGDVTFIATGSGEIDLGGGPLDAPFIVAKLDPEGGLLFQNGYESGLYTVKMGLGASGDIALTGASRLDEVSFGGDTLHAMFEDHEETTIAVLDAEGHHVWSRRLGTNEQDTFVDPTAIAITPEGDVILALGFTGTLDIDGATFTTVKDTLLAYDAVIARFDATGHLVWANQFHAAASTALPTIGSIAVTPDGDVAIAGGLYGASVSAMGLWKSAGESDAFIGVLAGETGEARWGRLIGGSGADTFGTLVAAPDGALVASGWFSGQVDVAGESLDTSGSAPFIGVFEPTGELRYARSLEGFAIGSSVRSLGLGPKGDLVMVASFDDFVSGFEVIQLDATAENELSRSSFPASSPDDGGKLIPNGFALDPLGNALLTGVMRGTADFGTGALTSEPWMDSIFVAKIAP